LVRYEDLVAGRVDIAGFARASGLNLTPEQARSAMTGGSAYRIPITAEQRDRINALTADGRRVLSYDE
jgi:hypothetical protein